jgi:hypothetical protein
VSNNGGERFFHKRHSGFANNIAQEENPHFWK